jgi:hypothetical protein
MHDLKLKVAMNNFKTFVSIFDATPGTLGSCIKDCKYCYNKKILAIHKSVKKKLDRNFKLLLEHPDEYHDCLVKDLNQIAIKCVDNVRCFAFGDYIHDYFDIAQKVFSRFYFIKFGIISKALTIKKYRHDLKRLIKNPNVFINLSFDKEIKADAWHKEFRIYNKNSKLVYTLDKNEEFDSPLIKGTYDIIFNVDKRKNAIEKYKQSGKFCQCDVEEIDHKLACLNCKQCYERIKK